MVNTALFTTFNFDPGFFELHILPLIFPHQKFSEVERVRLMQLTDCLHSIRNLAVYFDANALTHDGQSPKLGYERIAVHWRPGVFHPKIVCLIAEDPDNTGREILLVCCQSANITRAGWWENVECAHFEVVDDNFLTEQSCSFSKDLMALLQRIRMQMPNEDHPAINAVYRFLETNMNPAQDDDIDIGVGRKTRLFGGGEQLAFPAWLKEQAEIPEDWNLEVISPYFDKAKRRHPGAGSPRNQTKSNTGFSTSTRRRYRARLRNGLQPGRVASKSRMGETCRQHHTTKRRDLG